MQQLTREAYAKINLTLDVTGKRADGYHTVRMVMQTVSLHDTVTVTLDGTGASSIDPGLPYLPRDERNLALRAAHIFYAVTGIPDSGTHIALHKRIPVAAGLAGGSTDAAAVLHLLNDLHQAGLTTQQLCDIGLALGADVPYCIRGGTMLAEGIGEVLTPLPSMPPCFAVLVKPPFSVSTAGVYAQMQGGDLSLRPDTAGMIAALTAGDYNGVCRRLYNVMEEVTGARHPEIGQIENTLLQYGADGAVMSGSGPTTYGLFAEEQAARKAYAHLKKQYADTFFTNLHD